MIRLTSICLAFCIFGFVSIDAVYADAPVDVYMIVRQTATPVGETVTDTLPNSIPVVLVGTNYVVEIWMQDTWDENMPGGPSPGLTGGELDLHYDTDLSDAITLHYEGPFDWFLDHQFHTGEIFEGDGLVDDFSTATNLPEVGVTPDYARLGYVTFYADRVGTQYFVLDDATVARQGMGLVDLNQIHLFNVSVAQVPEPSTFVFLALGAIGFLTVARRKGRGR